MHRAACSLAAQGRVAVAGESLGAYAAAKQEHLAAKAPPRMCTPNSKHMSMDMMSMAHGGAMWLVTKALRVQCYFSYQCANGILVMRQ